MSLREIQREIRAKSTKVKKDNDPEYRESKKMILSYPGFLVAPIIKLLGFILYQLNIWSPLLKTPRDSFGSAMVTSVGNFGISRGFAPLVPFSHCPILISVGTIEERAIIKNEKIVQAPMITLGATLDHRLVDGFSAAKVNKILKEYLENPTLD